MEIIPVGAQGNKEFSTMDAETRQLMEHAEREHARAVADFCAERDELLDLLEKREAELQRRLARFRQRLHTEGKDGET